MIEISVVYPNESRYEDVSQFARKVYRDKLNSVTTATPDVFACAQLDDTIIGSIGLSQGLYKDELFFEMCNPPKAYERLADSEYPDRSLLGELGTRAVVMPRPMRPLAGTVSIALAAVIISRSYTMGIRYIGFVTNRTIHRITDPLKLTLKELGAPDYSAKDTAFQENMKGFLGVKQICAGFVIGSPAGCYEVITNLTHRGLIMYTDTPYNTLAKVA